MCKRLICLISVVLVLGVTAGVTNAGLVAYWPLDEGAGSVAHDSVGNHDGEFVGDPTWISPGKVGDGALDVDGSNYVNCGAGVTSAPDMTVAFWMNANSHAHQRPIAVSTGDYSTDPGWMVMLRIDAPPGGVWFRIHGSDAGGWAGGDLQINETVYEANTWVHMAFTFDSVTREIKGYINGELRGTDTAADGRTIANTVNDLRFGNTGTGEVYNGMLDEVAIWDNALTDDEVLDVYTLGPLALDPRNAGNPNPPDEATDVPRDVVLSWTAGIYADKHDVYFGDNFDDVNDATTTIDPNNVYKGRQNPDSYTVPETLDFGQTYYWRIDEVNAPPDYTVFKGSVWQFTVEPFAYPIENVTATASSLHQEGTGPENTVNGSGLDENDLHSTVTTDMWLSGATGPQPTWIRYEFDKVYKLYEMWVWNYNMQFESLIGFGLKDATIEYSTDGADWTVLGGVPDFAQGLGAEGYAHNTTIDFDGAVAKYVKITANSSWGDLAQYGLSEVRFFYIPVWAREPNPTSGATDVDLDVVLSWRAGREAASHDVYLSTNRQAVVNGTAPVNTLTEASYGPLSLDLGKTYYWRVDEANDLETPTTWKGDVWNFRTHEFIAVDDFESYDDYDNRIFYSWRDGWGFTEPAPGYPGNGTGSTVGYAQAPFAEQTIVHGGRQSMPLAYDNTGTAGKARYSETQREWASPQDWTKADVKALTLWFHGETDNTPETLYVAVEDSAAQVRVATHPNPEVLQGAGWQEWNVPLQQFSGVNLTSVKKMYIGLGNRVSPQAGGTGTIFIDDIRLYPARCVPSLGKPNADLSGNCIVDDADVEIMANQWLNSGFMVTPVDPGSAGLIAHYPFNGNTNDAVGGHHGTTTGLVSYAAGKIGQAIVLDGVDDLVTVGAVGISGAAPRTISGWAKAHATSLPDWINIFGFTGPSGGNGHFDIEHVNVGGNRGYGIHVYGWERVICPVDLEWHHLAASYDGTTIKWYGDGRLIGSDSSRVLDTPDNVHMGKRDDNENYWPGRVDEVRIFNRALSDAEVASLAGYTSAISIPADLYQDDVIDFKDFAVLADSWLDKVFWP